jgi:hypothetical protein
MGDHPEQQPRSLMIVGAQSGPTTSIRKLSDGTYEVDGDPAVASELVRIYENFSRP